MPLGEQERRAAGGLSGEAPSEAQRSERHRDFVFEIRAELRARIVALALRCGERDAAAQSRPGNGRRRTREASDDSSRRTVSAPLVDREIDHACGLRRLLHRLRRRREITTPTLAAYAASLPQRGSDSRLGRLRRREVTRLSRSAGLCRRRQAQHVAQVAQQRRLPDRACRGRDRRRAPPRELRCFSAVRDVIMMIGMWAHLRARP